MVNTKLNYSTINLAICVVVKMSCYTFTRNGGWIRNRILSHIMYNDVLTRFGYKYGEDL